MQSWVALSHGAVRAKVEKIERSCDGLRASRALSQNTRPSHEGSRDGLRVSSALFDSQNTRPGPPWVNIALATNSSGGNGSRQTRHER